MSGMTGQTTDEKEIVHKLYSAYSWIVDGNLPMEKHNARVLLEAAKVIEQHQQDRAEIERLVKVACDYHDEADATAKLNAKLTSALEKIAEGYQGMSVYDAFYKMIDDAKAALKSEGQDNE
jgi:hypothetical protein